MGDMAAPSLSCPGSWEHQKHLGCCTTLSLSLGVGFWGLGSQECVHTLWDGMGFPRECVARGQPGSDSPSPPRFTLIRCLQCPTKNTSWRKNRAEGVERDAGEGFPPLAGRMVLNTLCWEPRIRCLWLRASPPLPHPVL